MKAVERLKNEFPDIYQEYEKIVEEQFELFAKKHLDYGMSNISVGTQLETEEEVNLSLTGLWFRIQDKVSRWKNLLLQSKTKPQNESMQDTYQDIVNYGIIAQIVSRGKWRK